MRYILIFFVITILVGCNQKPNSVALETPNLKVDKKVFFKNLNNGDTVVSPFVVEMGVHGLKIHPAGELKTGTGHHHIIIDKGFMKFGEIIPMDANHLHYGKGDTIASLTLTQGLHQLTLQFANGLHMSYGEQFSNTINVYVK